MVLKKNDGSLYFLSLLNFVSRIYVFICKFICKCIFLFLYYCRETTTLTSTLGTERDEQIT